MDVIDGVTLVHNKIGQQKSDDIEVDGEGYFDVTENFSTMDANPAGYGFGAISLAQHRKAGNQVISSLPKQNVGYLHNYAGQTGTLYTPQTGNMYTQQTSTPYTQQTSTPYTQQTSTPYTQQTGMPYTQQTSTPYTQQTSTPYTQQTGMPYTQQIGNPYTQQTGMPYTQQTSTPYTQQTGMPYTQQIGNPYTLQNTSTQNTVMEVEMYDNVTATEEHGRGSGIKAFLDTDTRIYSSNGPVKKTTHSEFMALEYNTKHMNRGKAVIINNVVYADKKMRMDRDGSGRDADEMERVLKTLKFEPINRSNGTQPKFIYNDQTTKNVKDIMRDVSDAQVNDFTSYDCMVVVILSYGIEGAVMCCDGPTDEFIQMAEIVEFLKADRCPSLAMKPKLFFAQLCPAISYDIPDSVPVRDCVKKKEFPVMKKIPREADILLQYVTTPGTYGWWSHCDKGLSWYIESLSKALRNYCVLPIQNDGKSQNFNSVLMRVNQLFIKTMEENGLYPDREIGGPCSTSTLTRHLVFHRKDCE